MTQNRGDLVYQLRLSATSPCDGCCYGETMVAAAAEIERLRSDFAALQHAIVGNTGLSAILEAARLRALHPLHPVT